MRHILFWLGPVPVYAYAVFTVLAMVIGFWWARREFALRHLPQRLLWRMMPVIAILAFAGARALHVASHWSQYRSDWLLLIMRWRPGMSFHGAMFGSIIATWLVVRRTDVALSVVFDALAPGAALAHSIGRIGCFLNGCCYGVPTSLPWGVRFYNCAICPDDLPRHPTQLYEALGLILLFSWLIRRRHHAHYNGEQFAIWIGGYAILRFLVDFFRAAMRTTLLGLTHSQWLSMIMFAVAICYHCYQMMSGMHRSR